MQIVYTINTFCFWKPLYSKHWVRFVLIYHWYQLSGTFILLFNSVLRYTTITYVVLIVHPLTGNIFSKYTYKLNTNINVPSIFSTNIWTGIARLFPKFVYYNFLVIQSTSSIRRSYHIFYSLFSSNDFEEDHV